MIYFNRFFNRCSYDIGWFHSSSQRSDLLISGEIFTSSWLETGPAWEAISAEESEAGGRHFRSSRIITIDTCHQIVTERMYELDRPLAATDITLMTQLLPTLSRKSQAQISTVFYSFYDHKLENITDYCHSIMLMFTYCFPFCEQLRRTHKVILYSLFMMIYYVI